MTIDVVIIGSGPAGTMCGIELQRSGLTTCIIEREKLPRQKLCGGFLTQKTVDLIHLKCPEIEMSEYVTNQTHSFGFYHGSTRLMTVDTACTYYSTDRLLLDNLLVQYYKKVGGTVMESTLIRRDDIDFRRNTVTTDDEEISYRMLVGADGCNSIVTRAAGIVRHDMFCLEGRCHADDFDSNDLRLYLGCPRDGYAWFFPKKDYYTVGLGGSNEGKRMKTVAKEFFDHVIGRDVENVKGAFIPTGKKLSLAALPANVLLAGDAAGFIDPITGEGIYYALRTGSWAAEAIAECAGNVSDLHHTYNRKTAVAWKNIKHALRWHLLLYSRPVFPRFVSSLGHHERFARFYLERLVSTYEFNYKNFVWYYLLHRKR
jgi:geranylgeranyl reductase family protein